MSAKAGIDPFPQNEHHLRALPQRAREIACSFAEGDRPLSRPEVTTASAAFSAVNGGPAFTIDEFIVRNPMSRSKFFELKRRGLGPRMLLGRLISPEAEHDWRHAMEEAANSESAKLEQARRIELARRAGKAAAASPLHASRHQAGKKRKPSSPGKRRAR